MKEETVSKKLHRATQYETYKQVTAEKSVYFLVLHVLHDTTQTPWELTGYNLLNLFDTDIKFVSAADFSAFVEKGMFVPWKM